LRLSGLRYTYPGAEQATLRLEALALQPGERLMLRGPSGCGKSTLLSLAAGVLQAQEGSVEVMGRRWADLSPAARDAHRVDHVGYIFQQFNLLPYLGVLDNVLLPCGFSRRRRERAQGSHGHPARAAAALLDALELPASVHHRPAADLSVGQQQRVAAARALIGAPDIVIADEPTSALDEDRRVAFMRLLRQQCEKAGSALLFVTHDARLAQDFHRVVDLPALNQAQRSALQADPSVHGNGRVNGRVNGHGGGHRDGHGAEQGDGFGH
jgi:putative ABC transport system ATP-binding protein